MQRKGFASSAILYTLLLLFLVLMVEILNNLQNKKIILDALKQDTINALQQDTITDAILDQIALINSKVVEIEKNFRNLQNEVNQLKNENINGTYYMSIVFGYPKASLYTMTNTILIGDVTNKKITITSVHSPEHTILTTEELSIINQFIIKTKVGFYIYIDEYYIGTNVDSTRDLAQKLASYPAQIEFKIEDYD